MMMMMREEAAGMSPSPGSTLAPTAGVDWGGPVGATGPGLLSGRWERCVRPSGAERRVRRVPSAPTVADAVMLRALGP